MFSFDFSKIASRGNWLGIVFFALSIAAVTSSISAQEIDKKKDPVELAFDEIRTLSRSGRSEDAAKVKAILAGLQFDNLSSSQKETWISQSRENALRLADLVRLQELSKMESSFSSEKIYQVLLAYGKLTKAELAEATQLLDNLDIDGLNPREERRVYAIRAKIAQLQGDHKTERKYIEEIIEHLPYWTESHCQSCHNDLKNPERMTFVAFSELGFGLRFSELMKASGDAEKVRDLAKETLTKDPNDVLALIQLGYALKSLGHEGEALSAFKRIPFAKESGNELSQARMLFAFP